jgi:hypothetical protein
MDSLNNDYISPTLIGSSDLIIIKPKNVKTIKKTNKKLTFIPTDMGDGVSGSSESRVVKPKNAKPIQRTNKQLTFVPFELRSGEDDLLPTEEVDSKTIHSLIKIIQEPEVDFDLSELPEILIPELSLGANIMIKHELTKTRKEILKNDIPYMVQWLIQHFIIPVVDPNEKRFETSILIDRAVTVIYKKDLPYYEKSPFKNIRSKLEPNTSFNVVGFIIPKYFILKYYLYKNRMIKPISWPLEELAIAISTPSMYIDHFIDLSSDISLIQYVYECVKFMFDLRFMESTIMNHVQLPSELISIKKEKLIEISYEYDDYLVNFMKKCKIPIIPLYDRFSVIHMINMAGYDEEFIQHILFGNVDYPIKERKEIKPLLIFRNQYVLSNYISTYFKLFGKHIEAFNIEQFFSKISSDEKEQVEANIKETKEYQKKYKENKCQHIQALNEYYETKHINDKKVAFDKLSVFFDKYLVKKPNDIIGMEHIEKEMIKCKLCGFNILCPHDVIEIQLIDYPEMIIFKELFKFYTGVRDSMYYFCGTCKRSLYSYTDFLEYEHLTLLTEDENRILYSEAGYILKFIKLKFKTTKEYLIKRMINQCRQDIIDLSKRSELKDTKSLDFTNNTKVIYAAFLQYYAEMTKEIEFNVKDFFTSLKIKARSLNEMIYNEKLNQLRHYGVMTETDHIVVTWEYFSDHFPLLNLYKMLSGMSEDQLMHGDINHLTYGTPLEFKDDMMQVTKGTKQIDLEEILKYRMYLSTEAYFAPLTDEQKGKILKINNIIENDRRYVLYQFSWSGKCDASEFVFKLQMLALKYLYGYNGKKHMWNTFVLKGNKTSSVYVYDYKDLYSEPTDTYFKDANKLDEKKIQEDIDQKMNLENFYNLYYFKCPLGGSHEFDANMKCKKCSINISIKDPKMYKKYSKQYTKDTEKNIKELEEITKKPKEKETKIDVSKYVYDEKLVTTIIQIFSLDGFVLKNIGKFSGLSLDDIKVGLQTIPPINTTSSFPINILHSHITNLYAFKNSHNIFDDQYAYFNSIDHKVSKQLSPDEYYKFLCMFLFINIMEFYKIDQILCKQVMTEIYQAELYSMKSVIQIEPVQLIVDNVSEMTEVKVEKKSRDASDNDLQTDMDYDEEELGEDNLESHD